MNLRKCPNKKTLKFYTNLDNELDTSTKLFGDKIR